MKDKVHRYIFRDDAHRLFRCGLFLKLLWFCGEGGFGGVVKVD